MTWSSPCLSGWSRLNRGLTRDPCGLVTHKKLDLGTVASFQSSFGLRACKLSDSGRGKLRKPVYRWQRVQTCNRRHNTEQVRQRWREDGVTPLPDHFPRLIPIPPRLTSTPALGCPKEHLSPYSKCPSTDLFHSCVFADTRKLKKSFQSGIR